MSELSPYDGSNEPTEVEHAEALAHFRAARGRYPGVSDELRRSRLAEIEADYSAEDDIPTLKRRRESASVEL